MKSPLAEAARQRSRAIPRNTSTLPAQEASRFASILSVPAVAVGRPPKLLRTVPVTARKSTLQVNSWPRIVSLPPTLGTRRIPSFERLGNHNNIGKNPQIQSIEFE